MGAPPRSRRARAAARFAVAVGGLLSIPGCGLLWDTDVNPEEIRVRLESETSGDVELILGDRFFLGSAGDDGGATVTLISADTVLVSPPYDERFDLAPSFQFFVQALLTDSLASPREIRIQILVDGETRYDKAGTLGEEDFEFVYNFN